MLYILNGDKYEWIELEVTEEPENIVVPPTVEERLEAAEGAIIDIAEVLFSD